MLKIGAEDIAGSNTRVWVQCPNPQNNADCGDA